MLLGSVEVDIASQVAAKKNATAEKRKIRMCFQVSKHPASTLGGYL